MTEIRAAKAALGVPTAPARSGGKRRARARRSGGATNNVSYTRPYRQGMAAVTTAPFNTTRAARDLRFAFDATHPSHLPLPRAIGGYATIRTTTLHRTQATVIILGPTMSLNATTGERAWSSCVGIESTLNPAVAMNSASGASAIVMEPIASSTGVIQSGWANCELTPAAYTVQVMYPSPVGTAGGIARIGKLKTKSALANNSRTWNTFADQFTSYNAPRLCAGGKLCLRGVSASCTPYDMNDLAEFSPIKAENAGVFTWTSNIDFEGFSPIVIVNELSTADPPLVGSLELLITVEWRVRFDPSNPAQAAHVLHPPTTESTWARAVAMVENAGHGVFDIAERVAEFGAEHPRLVAAAAGVMRA